MAKTSTSRRGKGGKEDNGGGGKQEQGTLTIPEFNVPTLGDNRHNYTPWLVIRCEGGDFGGRPLPSGTVFWESPDVWVKSSLGINQPVVGQANAVFAEVSNFGLQQANGVVVKFWWANPSLAITESNAHPIGIGFANIPAKHSIVVECPTPWVPIEENEGHECLIAEAYVPIYDPLTAPLDPVLDRHVGQKNEHLETIAPGGKFHFTLHGANLAPLRQTVAFDVQAVSAGRLPTLFDRRTELRDVALSPPSTQLPLTLQVHPEASSYVSPDDSFARSLLALSAAQKAGAAGCIAFPWISRSAELEPWEGRVIDVSGVVPPDAQIGQTFMFRLIQRIGPIVTGGYSIGVLVA